MGKALEKDEPMNIRAFRIKDSAYKQLQALAHLRGMTPSDLMRDVLHREVEDALGGGINRDTRA